MKQTKHVRNIGRQMTKAKPVVYLQKDEEDVLIHFAYRSQPFLRQPESSEVVD